MDKRLTAILLRATDNKENDKQVRLFTVEEGVITANMRGVKKANARLKFAAQPFAFCEYELNEKRGNYTVTGASVIEDTYALCESVEKFSTASLVSEVIENASLSIDSQALFIVMLKTLKAILYSGGSLMLIVTKFMQKVLSMTGFTATHQKRETYPDTASGLLDRIAFLTLDELSEVDAPQNRIKSAFTIVLHETEKVFETKLKSVKFFLEMNN